MRRRIKSPQLYRLSYRPCKRFVESGDRVYHWCTRFLLRDGALVAREALS